MRNLFTLKLITQNPRKFVPQTFRSDPLPVHRTTNATPHHHHHSFSNHTGCFQQFQEVPTRCLMKCLSNPVVFNRVLFDGFLKLKETNKLALGFEKFGFLSAQFSRHNFRFNQTVGFQRNWLSQLRRRLTTDGVVIGLIVTNVAVFLLWRVADPQFMMKNFMTQLDNFKSGRLHTMITSAFSHNEVGHIVTNMIGLYFFGRSIGYQFGPEFLLKLYLAGAFVGSVFYFVHHAFLATSSKDRRLFEPDPSRVPGLGASGAVNAIMLLDIFLNPKKTIYLEFIIPVPAILLGIFLVGHDVMKILEGNSQISGSAHLGGAAVAAIAWARLRKGRF
ncbi:RHOMBOID-like protein 12, mitochondrial [Bidens hawaiensis]|uniref:RHOMBOID-like protein 12, mitochondrial n=1 Tax=Bidens hawaiensis TaxID=980011 RepID=UPI00404A5E82